MFCGRSRVVKRAYWFALPARASGFQRGLGQSGALFGPCPCGLPPSALRRGPGPCPGQSRSPPPELRQASDTPNRLEESRLQSCDFDRRFHARHHRASANQTYHFGGPDASSPNLNTSRRNDAYDRRRGARCTGAELGREVRYPVAASRGGDGLMPYQRDLH